MSRQRAEEEGRLAGPPSAENTAGRCGSCDAGAEAAGWGVVQFVQSVDGQTTGSTRDGNQRREIRVYDQASSKCSKLRDVAGAAPGEADAGAAVTVVMEEPVSSNRRVGFASD